MSEALIVNRNSLNSAIEITGRSREELEEILDRAEAKNVICAVTVKG